MTTSFPQVHVYTSSPEAFFVNSFIIEGERSLVLIDTQFVLSEATKLVSQMKELEKSLAAILITHPHPDHFNGLGTVLAAYPETPVYATQLTASGMRATAEAKRDYWTPIIGADYPQSFAWPNATVQDGDRLNIEDMEFLIHDFGPTECSDNTAIALPQIDAVVISDLVYNRVHPWLAEGRSGLWLAALSSARDKFGEANVLYAGHGVAGPTSIMNEQADYINTVREIVADSLEGGALADSAKAKAGQRVRSLYPDYPLEAIIDLNLDCIAKELEESSAMQTV